MILIAQNIDKNAHLTVAMHKPCAQPNAIAQNDMNSVRSIKSMHSACAFKTLDVQKLCASAPLRETKTPCN